MILADADGPVRCRCERQAWRMLGAQAHPVFKRSMLAAFPSRHVSCVDGIGLSAGGCRHIPVGSRFEYQTWHTCACSAHTVAKGSINFSIPQFDPQPWCHVCFHELNHAPNLLQVDADDPVGSRREYQAWRIWGLKRARAAMAAGQAAPISIDRMRGSSADKGTEEDDGSPPFGKSDTGSLFGQSSSFDGRANALSSLAPVKVRTLRWLRAQQVMHAHDKRDRSVFSRTLCESRSRSRFCGACRCAQVVWTNMRNRTATTAPKFPLARTAALATIMISRARSRAALTSCMWC